MDDDPTLSKRIAIAFHPKYTLKEKQLMNYSSDIGLHDYGEDEMDEALKYSREKLQNVLQSKGIREEKTVELPVEVPEKSNNYSNLNFSKIPKDKFENWTYINDPLSKMSIQEPETTAATPVQVSESDAKLEELYNKKYSDTLKFIRGVNTDYSEKQEKLYNYVKKNGSTEKDEIINTLLNETKREDYLLQSNMLHSLINRFRLLVESNRIPNTNRKEYIQRYLELLKFDKGKLNGFKSWSNFKGFKKPFYRSKLDENIKRNEEIVKVLKDIIKTIPATNTTTAQTIGGGLSFKYKSKIKDKTRKIKKKLFNQRHTKNNK